MTNPIDFSTMILLRSVLFSPICSITCSLVTFSGHFIFSILHQHHISKLFKYFRSNFLSAQVSESYKTMLQTYHLTNFFLSSVTSLPVNGDFFLRIQYISGSLLWDTYLVQCTCLSKNALKNLGLEIHVEARRQTERDLKFRADRRRQARDNGMLEMRQFF